MGANALMAIIGVVIIVCAAYAQKESYVSQMPLIIGLIVLGVFLILICLVGWLAVIFKSQLLLSIYIVLMTLFFVVHFSLSVAIVAASKDQEFDACKAGWCALDQNQQQQVQNHFGCLTFDGMNSTSVDASCNKATAPDSVPSACIAPNECSGCYPHLSDQIAEARLFAGGVSLTLCFFELLAISFAVHFRRASKLEWAKNKGYTREIL